MIRWIVLLVVADIGLVLGLSFYLQPTNFSSCMKAPVAGVEGCEKADAIVVISGGNTSARTEAGIDLYLQGWADTLIFSGAAYDKSGPSNAATMKEAAVARGVPEGAIILDEEAETTQQNAEQTQQILRAQNYDDIILVTSGYHQRRASIAFSMYATDITVRNYPVVNDGDWGWWWFLTPRGWWLAGGEVVKIIATYAGAA